MTLTTRFACGCISQEEMGQQSMSDPVLRRHVYCGSHDCPNDPDHKHIKHYPGADQSHVNGNVVDRPKSTAPNPS